MRFLEILWELVTMWGLWLCFIIAVLSCFLMQVIGEYIATFSPILALVFLVVGMLLTVTTIIWIADKSS